MSIFIAFKSDKEIMTKNERFYSFLVKITDLLVMKNKKADKNEKRT